MRRLRGRPAPPATELYYAARQGDPLALMIVGQYLTFQVHRIERSMRHSIYMNTTVVLVNLGAAYWGAFPWINVVCAGITLSLGGVSLQRWDSLRTMWLTLLADYPPPRHA